ncbi:MAG: type II toxin-antitoxin system VapC family toxin [Armatimonadia bacterium]
MKLIDSCGWLDFILKGPNAETYRDYLLADNVLVPTVVMYEVYKVISRDISEELAAQTAVQMKTKQLAPLTDNIALLAAELALKHRLGMADAIVYATARVHGATLVTSDFHFANIEDVEYLPGS